MLGLKTLQGKVAKLECMVLEADKGKTFVVVDERTYRAMADDHISTDPVVTQEEVRESQLVLTSTGKSLANILNLGMNQSYKNYIRCFDNTGSVAEDVPNLKLLPKVHKPPAPAGHPQSRPVVAAASGLSSRAGDLLSDFLEPLIAADLPRHEDLSTEEVLSQLEEAQTEIKRLGLRDTMAGSLDVRALYPSLDQERAAESVAMFVRRSKVKIEGVDWRETQVFLASNMDEHEQKREGVLGLLPRRLKKWGARPGNRTEELRRRLPDPKGDNPGRRPTKWSHMDPEKDLTDTQRRLLLSLVAKVATRNVFHHHMYCFDGDPRRQAHGGPIGLRLTSIVAWIVMDEWMAKFLCAITKAGLVILAAMKYVDDINLVVSMLALGTRWVGDKFIVKEHWRLEDLKTNRSQQDVTIEAIRMAADSILPDLEFTADIPERHESNTVPMLDIQVWVQHPDSDSTTGLGHPLLDLL